MRLLKLSDFNIANGEFFQIPNKPLSIYATPMLYNAEVYYGYKLMLISNDKRCDLQITVFGYLVDLNNGGTIVLHTSAQLISIYYK